MNSGEPTAKSSKPPVERRQKRAAKAKAALLQNRQSLNQQPLTQPVQSAQQLIPPQQLSSPDLTTIPGSPLFESTSTAQQATQEQDSQHLSGAPFAFTSEPSCISPVALEAASVSAIEPEPHLPSTTTSDTGSFRKIQEEPLQQVVPSRRVLDCPICLLPQVERIDGWILAGVYDNKLVEWANALEDLPCRITSADFDYHLNSGHIHLDEPRVLGMLIRFSREAYSVISSVQSGEMRGTDSVNTAMKVRLRAIELAAQVKGILGVQRSQKIVANVNLSLDDDTKRRMAKEALRQLEAPKA